MKMLISGIVGLLIGYLVFFQLDPWIISNVMEMANPPADIAGIVKLCAWAVLLFLSGGATLAISFAIGAFAYGVLETFNK